MRLTSKNLAPYLLDKGFADYDSFMKGDYKVIQQQNRNSILRVYRSTCPALFVKQPSDINQQNIYLLQKDATSQYLIKNDKDYAETASYVPAYFGYDSSEHVLVTELLPNAKNLHEIITEKKTFDIDHAEDMGKIIASYHFDIREKQKENSSLQFFSGTIPWVLRIPDKREKFDWNHSDSDKGSAIINVIRGDKEFVSSIDKLCKNWQSISLIHGDIKWLNFIVGKKYGATEESLQLIDWEVADIGDPLWDVAGVFQSYLSSWIMSFNPDKNKHEQLPEFSFFNLEKMKPAMQAFWKAYSVARKFNKEENEAAYKTALGYTACRLIQTAIESNLSYKQHLTSSARMVQLSRKLLISSEKASQELFGI